MTWGRVVFMRYLLPIIELSLILFAGSKPPAIPAGKVLRVIDGDGLVVQLDGEPVSLRLAGIDAPELKQPGGPQAREALALIALGQTVQVLERDTDRYGRQVAFVWLRGQSLGQLQLRGGHAWHYAKYGVSGYAAIEREARRLRVGIWGDGAADVEPWVWRKSH